MKDISIEYAHIYTNNRIGEEQKFSLSVLSEAKNEFIEKSLSLVVMVDDYSFPDPAFDYKSFTDYLSDKSHKPDLVLRESQLIPLCDEVLNYVEDFNLKNQISDYIKTKKYPCSLFIATWYLLRLGKVESSIFNNDLMSRRLINILPLSFKPFEDKAFEIIESTKFANSVDSIENRYFEGRMLV